MANDFIRDFNDIRILLRGENPELNEWGQQFQIHYGDLLSPEVLEKACEEIDVVIHLASPNEIISKENPELAVQTNAMGTRNLLVAAQKAGVKKFIYLSTFHVYGCGEGVVSEASECWPKADYATTHLFGEYYCRQFSQDFDVSILRLTNGYAAPLEKSIDRWSLIMNNLCWMAVEKGQLELRSHGHQKRDFVWIGDLAQAIRLLIGKTTSSGEIYNVSRGESISMRELALLIGKVYQSKYQKTLPIVFSNPNDESAPDPQIELRVEHEKLSELGWSPHDQLEVEIDRIFTLLDQS
jgi:UDP-glucose 4-epimerase